MINFCHISPTNILSEVSKYNKVHLVLAHLVESKQKYRDFYANINEPIIMDNSAFEMFKQNRPMYPSNKLIEMGKSINATYIVLSDYPNEHSSKTIEAAKQLIPIFKQEGFKTFFVPQSLIGDIDDYINCWKYALNNPGIDLIGMSILGAPNAFGVEKDNKLQRFLSRWKIFNMLKDQNILTNRHTNKIHMLGMVDGPNEILLVEQFHKYIYSWDSSAAVWAGLNNIRFDSSPTGLVNGKFESHVDFDSCLSINEDVMYNIQYMHKLLEK